MSEILFFRPEFFWALSFIGIIILLHFLKRPKTVRLDFSTLRFFHNLAVRSTRTRRIRRILQLLTRILIVAILIALFAGPHKNNDPSGNLFNPQSDIYCWVDPTMSMEYRHNGISIGQKAHDLLDSLNHYLPASSRLFMYDHVSESFNLKKFDTEQFESSYSPLDIDNFFKTIIKNRNYSEKSLVILFSDFQEFSTKKIDSTIKELPKKISVICVSLTPQSPWNYTLKDVNLVNDNKVKIDVCAFGRDLEKGELFSETGNMRTETALLDVRKTECINRKLSVSGKGNLQGGKVILNADDPLQFDNISFFAPKKQNKYRVLIVGDIKKNSVIASALKVSGKKWNPVILKDEIKVAYSDLDSADIIIMNSISGISKTLNAFISAHSNKEKLFIFALDSDKRNAVSQNQWDHIFGQGAFKNVSSSKFVKKESPLTLILPDTISDLWKGFPKIRSDGVAFYEYYNGIPGENILHLSNRSGFMSQIKDKLSRNWIILSTPLGITEDNNLCETGFFVPFIDRVCWYGITISSVKDNNRIAGVAYRNPFHNSGINASVFDSGNKLVVSLQNQPSVKFEMPGIYKIVPEGKKPYYINVTADPGESVLSYRQPQIYDNSINMPSDKFLSTLSSRQSGLLWFLPWMILFCLITIEILLWERKKT